METQTQRQKQEVNITVIVKGVTLVFPKECQTLF